MKASEGQAVRLEGRATRDAGRGGKAMPARVGAELQRMVVQASASASTPTPQRAGEASTIAAAGVRGAASRLPHRDVIQAAFGHHDISEVAVERGEPARAASTELAAHAYTFGDRIALPRADLWTEAHEAAHVIQQRSGRVAIQGRRGDPHERHADAVADRVVAGQSAVALLDVVAEGPASAPQLQCFTTTQVNIAGNWGYRVAAIDPQLPASELAADAAYNALVLQLQGYEQAPSVATAELVINRTTDFLAAHAHILPLITKGDHARIGTQAKKLLDEASADFHARLQTTATTPVIGQTPMQLVDGAVAAVTDPERKKQQRRILRLRQKLGMNTTEKVQVANTDGPAIVQSWRARGDMYHVGAVLNLFPQLKVILYDLEPFDKLRSVAEFEREHERAERWEQASVIADYYGQPQRVFHTMAKGVAGKADKGAAYDFHKKVTTEVQPDLTKLFIDVGGCTTILGLELARARGQGTYGQRKLDLARAVAPDPQVNGARADATEVRDYLGRNGWATNSKYVLINFRDSGHAYIQKQNAAALAINQALPNYDPVRDQIGGNHPDLDTGMAGVAQLAQLVTARGFVPVFMGEEPANAQAPHLIKYWTFKHTYGPNPNPKSLCRGGRAAEAYFIRVIAETYDVRLLSMRSGVTDQLAFLGIPTLSIDIDNFHQRSVPELFAKPGYELGDDETAHSWARGSKLESGMGRDYGRVFLDKQRKLDDFDQHGKWKGTIHNQDLAAIDDALGFYFGTAQAAASATSGIRHSSHPLHPTKLAATKLTAGNQPLANALGGKIDTGLNPEVVVEHIRILLAAGGQQKIAEATRFADSHLEFIASGDSQVAARNIDHRAAKLAQRVVFLATIIPLFEVRDGHAKYVEERALILGLGQRNRPRVAKLELLLAALGKATDIRGGLDHKDKKVAKYFAVIDAIDLRPHALPLATAKAACDVERPEVQAQQLDPIAAALKDAHTKLSAAVKAALTQHDETTYYGRWFVPARDLLAGLMID